MVKIPTSTYARLLAIEAAARNAMENSWRVDRGYDHCQCVDWYDCTVLDEKDAAELWEALNAR